MNTTEKPVTLITGARKGIGKFLAQHCLEKGHVVYGCSREKTDWNAPDYHHIIADVRDEGQVLALFKELSSKARRLDNLINNAGVAAMNHFLLTPLETARAVMETNYLGTFLFCREAARLMQRRKRGRIVNFSTVAVPLKLEGEAAYAASKSAVTTLTQVLARELAPMGITVNAVGPGPIETDLIKNVPHEKLEKLLERQAIKKFGSFEDVANVVDFLLADASAMVTGQTLYLGGV